ncbi:MAG: helix-turn-helix protein [Bacteroidota bacterium]|jgi:transcriptional regulator with XRE-family HTH domain
MNKYPNIKALRIQNNYKQEYVADVLGVSQPEYSKIETGGRRIDAFLITELCKLYDVKMDELLRRDIDFASKAAVSELNHGRGGYASTMSNDLFIKLMDNYTALMESYMRQQQNTERIINHLFDQSRV